MFMPPAAPPAIDDQQLWQHTDYAEQIAAAVLGAEPLPLNHPGRAEAIIAMNALGYSSTYIAEQIGIRPQSLGNIASKLRVKLTPKRGFVDRIAVEFVVQGTPMSLRDNDLDAALIALAERGQTVTECARLLCTSSAVIQKHAADLGLELAEHVGQCWWTSYGSTSTRKGHQS